jgi:hypothetical protein
MKVGFSALKHEVWLPGVDMEAAFRHPEGGYLLFSTNDVPFEETLNVVLLDEVGQIIDTKSIFSAYATGHLHNMTISGTHAVSFSFFSEDRWVAEVASGRMRHWPRWLPRFIGRSLRVRKLYK